MDLIQIRQGETVLALHGVGISAPFRGAVYRTDQPGHPVEGEQSRSEIELALEGTPAQIEAGLARLGCLLEEARRWASIPGGEHVYLEVRVAPGGLLWRSRLTGGRIQTFEGAQISGAPRAGADARALGAQAARLAVDRFDYWEGPEMDLPLSNPGGSRVTGGLEISNCWDAARANYADLGQEDADALAEISDLPAPVILHFASIDAASTGTLYAFQNIYSSPAGLNPVIEGEAGMSGGGVSGTIISEPSASGGQYQRLSWSGEAQVAAWTSSLFPQAVARCAGQPFVPVARLAHPLAASEKLWYFWRMTVSWAGPETVLDSPGCYLPASSTLCPGVPLFLPPWPVGPDDTPAGLGLELRVQAEGSGSHQIDLDYLYLMPLDGWRIYRPALTTWGGGLEVHDDPVLGTLRAGDWAIQTHTAEGPGLRVIPGRAARFHFLADGGSGAASDFLPGARSRVRLSCRPRRRAL